MTDNKSFNKDRYFGHDSIMAKFSGECPYCHHDIVGMDAQKAHVDHISSGPKGWGHDGCVNAKWHYNSNCKNNG